MDYYNSKDFSSMQEEAIKRVQEMQRRSKNLVRESKESSDPQPEPKPHRSANHHITTNPSGLLGSLLGVNNAKKEQGNDELFNIGNIKIDEEKALIALMIYILYKNGADIKLLLGLGYLLI